jgi:hypothetical protein
MLTSHGGLNATSVGKIKGKWTRLRKLEVKLVNKQQPKVVDYSVRMTGSALCVVMLIGLEEMNAISVNIQNLPK